MVLCLLGRCSTMSHSFSFFFFLNRVSHIYAWASSDCNTPIYTSLLAGITCMHHHVQLSLVEMGVVSQEFLDWASLELQTS
jgi:hypothetical protein